MGARAASGAWGPCGGLLLVRLQAPWHWVLGLWMGRTRMWACLEAAEPKAPALPRVEPIAPWNAGSSRDIEVIIERK